MGSGSSRARSEDDSPLQRVKAAVGTKIAVMTAFKSKEKPEEGHTSPPSSADDSSKMRSEVYDMLQRSKQEKEDNWRELQDQYTEDTQLAAEEHPKSPTKIYTFQAPDLVNDLSTITSTITSTIYFFSDT